MCWISRKSMISSTAAHLQVAPGHDVVEHGHALEERDVLEGARDAQSRGLVRVHVGKFFLLELDLSLLRVINAVQDIEHRAFAGAVRADDGAHFLGAHVERHVLQRLDAAEGE
jgi:hypothetical protein